MRKRDRWGLGAFTLYLILALFFFGRGLFGHVTTFHIGEGPDPELMMWFLAWWPYSSAHHVNPFVTHTIWVPTGFNVTWSTSIPLLSLIAAPLTSAFGPILSLNVLCILGLAISAWSAFVLCRYVSGTYAGSLLGGYIFGFGPMVLAQLLYARLHSIWLFPIPLIVCLALRWFRQELETFWLVLWLALLLAVQFLVSPETFASMTVFGGIAFAVTWLTDPTRRSRVLTFTCIAGGAYVAAIALVSPYLYAFIGHAPCSKSLWSDHMLSADLLNYIIPNPSNELGRLPWFEKISGPFNWGEVGDTGAFLSWPLVAMAVVFARRHWSENSGRLLVDLLVIILLLALGPLLMVRGQESKVGLPWALFQIGVLKNAAPVRFCQYGFLILGLMTALWFSTTLARTGFRIAVAAVVFACLLPNLSPGFWDSATDSPQFFRTDLYKKYISSGDTVFVIPVWPRNEAMMWQAQSKMYFNLAQGAGPWPATVANWPILDAFIREQYLPHAAEQLKAYLIAKKVAVLIVDDREPPIWRNVVSGLGVTPQTVGGVSLYRLNLSAPGSTNASLDKWRKCFDEQRMEMLIVGIQDYLSHGGIPDDLKATQISKLQLIPVDDVVGPPAPPAIMDAEENWDRLPEYRYGMILYIDHDRIVVGETAWRPVAEELINRYRNSASEVRYSPPLGYRGTPEDETGVLLMSFDRAQMARAAAIALEVRNDSCG